MPTVLSENGQTRCRNCYAPSAQARLSLRVNGEEKGVVIPAGGVAVIPAGFDAPTALPTVGTNGAGNVPVGFYVYRYVYLSSRYPFVQNDVTVDGEQWPRSNPSPPSATYQVTPAAESNAITVTYSTRSDVDWIAVYRTPNNMGSAALAEAQDAAGELYFVEMVANNTAGGTTAVTDNNAANSGERIEFDNFTCPLFRQACFDGTYFWGWGNRTLEVVVTLDGTGAITLNTALSNVDSWFSGRDTTPAGFNLATGPNGNSISFRGITTGGYDGRGNFYFRTTSATTGSVYNSAAMVTPTAIPATGNTTAYLTSPTSTLYRSKPLNPFSWGETTETANVGGRGFTRVPALFAEPIGGGVGTAINLVANERILMLHTEAPERSYALDLNAAGTSNFLLTLRTLDTAQSTGSHFSVFPMRLPNGQSVSGSINAKALTLLSADAQSQIPIGNEVFETLHRTRREDGEAVFFHGAYDRNSDLNCWWVKTTDSPYRCDTLIYQHAPTGTWGTKYMPGVSASWTVYDSVTETYYTFIGTEEMVSGDPQGGMVGVAFYPDLYRDWITEEKTTPTGTINNDGAGTISFSIPYIALISTVTGTAPSLTVNTTAAHGLAPGQIVALGVTVPSNPVTVTVMTTPTSTSFTISSYEVGTGSGGAVFDPIFNTPFVAFQSSSDSFYLGMPFDPVDTNLVSTSGGAASFAFANVGAETAINLNTNAFQTGSLYPNGENFTAYWGCVPSFLRRYFNASVPQKNKTQRQIWATMQNVDTALNAQHLKFYLEYRSTLPVEDAAFLVQMRRDAVGISGTYGNSDAYHYDTPPDVLAHSFGLQWQELGYSAWRVLDFTFKQQET